MTPPTPTEGLPPPPDPDAAAETSPWPATWQAFCRALRDPHQEFAAWTWLQLLASAGGQHLYIRSGGAALVHKYRPVGRALVPYFGLSLVGSILVAYATCLRQEAVQARWCCASQQAKDATHHCTPCHWLYVHDAVVAYFGVMIFFHYLATVLGSPGVALASRYHNDNEPPPHWKAMASQGGLLGWDTSCITAQERSRVALYGSLPSREQVLASRQASSLPHPATNSVPSPTPSFCDTCQIVRPPRCRHCSLCQRCVLQFDHHCLWVNQCIGYANYRHFVLMLVFLVGACWYGVALFCVPFYEPFRAQIREKGLHWLYGQGTGLLDLPMPARILQHVIEGDVPVKLVLDVVYPLLLGLGAILTTFLGFHAKYILTGRTTLEHAIVLEQQMSPLRAWWSRRSARPSRPVATPAVPVNPFDQGYRRNLRQVLGPSWLACLLPMRVTPPPPYLPDADKSQ